MRLTGEVVGVLVAVLLFGGAQAAAHGTGGYAFAIQEEGFCEVIGAMGTLEADDPANGTPPALAVDDNGTPVSEGAIDVTGTPFVDDATPAVGTPIVEATDILGDDGVLDEDDEGALCRDVDDDGTNEIGFDQDKNGMLEEGEVLGSDVNNDEALTEDELDF